MGLFPILRYNNKDKDMNKYVDNNILSSSVRMLRKLADNTNSNAEFKYVLSATSISKFTSRLASLTEKVDCTDYELGKDIEECKRKVKGDMFELFTVLFFNAFGGDRSLFLHDIKWAYRDQVGYDFTATNKEGDVCIIQSKFVANASAKFEKDGRLETFFGSLPEGVVIKKDIPSRVLFTTASNVGSYYLNEQRRSSKNFLIIDKKFINRFTKDNLGFWKFCEEKAKQLFPEKVGSLQ